LAERRSAGKPRRYPLTLSTATGPPLPGIDISNSAALQEMDDLEYVERLRNGLQMIFARDYARFPGLRWSLPSPN
jgi:hypothetical protein